jgi:hypothetical protein
MNVGFLYNSSFSKMLGRIFCINIEKKIHYKIQMLSISMYVISKYVLNMARLLLNNKHGSG